MVESREGSQTPSFPPSFGDRSHWRSFRWRPAPPIRNLFSQALSLPCWALVPLFYEWSSKLAVRVTSGQAVMTTDEIVALEGGSAAAIETGELAMRLWRLLAARRL